MAVLVVAVVETVVVVGASIVVVVGIGVAVVVAAVQALPKYLVVVPDAKGFNIVVMSSTTIRVAKGFCGFLDLFSG